MLFSNKEIANYVNQNFVSSWQSVRDVPTISFDFGQGKTLKRTLNGNIATYVCTADGKVLDVLPGLYEPEAFKDRLQQLELLYRFISPMPEARQSAALLSYHRIQQSLLSKAQQPARFIETNEGIKLVQTAMDANQNWSKPLPSGEGERKTILPKDDLATWEKLTADVRFNETQMRKVVHERLASVASVKPNQISHWLYREVLHADIDDPYLGLSPVLFSAWPFSESPAKMGTN